jgi:predicted small secreted protein
MTKTQILTVCALVCALFVASCANTVRGVGRDVRDTADAVEDTVN